MLDNAVVLVRQPTVVTSEDLWSKVSTGKVKILYSLPTLAYQKEETVFFFLFDTLRLSLWSWMFSVPLIGKSYTIQLEINPVSLLNWCGVCSGFAGFHLTNKALETSFIFCCSVRREMHFDVLFLYCRDSVLPGIWRLGFTEHFYVPFWVSTE